MKKAPIFTRRSLIGCAGLWVLLREPLGCAESVAAEGYRAFAQRIVSNPPQGAVIDEGLEEAIFQALNGYRLSKHRKALRRASADMRLAARAQAMDLLQMAAVNHDSSTGHSFESRMRAILGKPMFLPAMAENAARDRRENIDSAGKAKAIMEQWIKSGRHRRSLTDRSYVAVATGAARRGMHVYAVQIFVGPETKTNLFH